MAYDSALADRVTDLLQARRVAFETKAMMGGLCFMVDGKMCVGVEKARLMVRLDPAGEGEARARPGCKPMDFTGRPMRGYVFVHPEGYGSEALLGHWIGLALEFNPRAKASKKNANRRQQAR
jgi:TfoX/Sxy family transcriptional regulator of competence genes